MVFNIILNSSNVVNPNNTFYAKSFIGGSLTIPPGSQMCVSQIVMPYSWFNITKNYNNNIFSYFWNGYYPSVIWNGTLSSTTFTGSADTGSSGTFVSGQLVLGDYLAAGTTVSTVGATIGLSAGATGGSPTVITGIPTFTGYVTMVTISGISTPVLTLSSTVTGTFALNTVLYSSNTSLGSNVYVKSLYSGTLGGVGSQYILGNQTVAVASVGSPMKFGFIGTFNTITIPDGFYQVTDLNNYIQTYMISQNQYIYNSTLLQNQYFLNLFANSTYYSNQFILQSIPSSQTEWNTLNSGSTWTYPTGFAFSGLSYTPQVSIVANITDYLGLSAGIYPSTYSTSNASVISNITPVGSYVNSVVVRCNLISNDATTPTDILDTFYPNNDFGANIVYEPAYEKWIDLIEGTYNNMYIYFNDQNGNQIFARDSNVLISLLIKFGEVYYDVPSAPPPIETPVKVQIVNPLEFRE